MADLKQVMSWLEWITYDDWPEYHSESEVQTIAKEALEILKKQEPIPPVHIHEEYPEHDWERDGDGEIDIFALDDGYHNGPACKRCNYCFCMHCKPNGWDNKQCIIDQYRCPTCGKYMCNDEAYCSKCGQAVKWDG